MYLSNLKLTAIMLGVASLAAEASLVVYDGFDGVPQGFSQSYPASNHAGLSYGSLQVGSGAYERLGGPDSVAILNTPLTSTTATDGTYSSSGVVWMSWLYQPGANEDWSRLLIFNNNTDAAGGESYNLGQFGTTMGIYGPFGSTGSTTGIINASDTYFLVTKIDFGSSSANDGALTLWWNPSNASLGQGLAPADTAQSPITLTSLPESHLEVLRLNLGGGAGPVFDELRIGSTWAEVSPTAIPEPAVSVLSLASLTCLLMIWHRRRQK